MSGDIHEARDLIAGRLGGREPSLAIVLGSGLGGLADRITGAVRIPYPEIPGFHQPRVEGHKGELVVGGLGGRTVLVHSGRFHMYEGYSADAAALPVRVFAALGIRSLLVTNAAGGIRRSYGHGTIMLIADHLNLTGRNPLVGHTPEAGASRGALGPDYETPSEVRMLERLGADAVGMSTVVEVIAARALGMRCLGFSLVTNPGAGISAVPLSHADVMDIAGKAGGELARLVEAVVEAL